MANNNNEYEMVFWSPTIRFGPELYSAKKEYTTNGKNKKKILDFGDIRFDEAINKTPTSNM